MLKEHLIKRWSENWENSKEIHKLNVMETLNTAREFTQCKCFLDYAAGRECAVHTRGMPKPSHDKNIPSIHFWNTIAAESERERLTSHYS